MGACETACCGPESHNIDTFQQSGETIGGHKPFSQANLFELVVRDEKQLRKLENVINQGVSTAQLTREISAQPKQTLQLLSKQDKNIEEYESKLDHFQSSFKNPIFRTLP